MQLIGYDLGSSSIKACVLETQSGKVIASATSPEHELPMDAPQKGWAEQDPEEWWEHIKIVTSEILQVDAVDIEAIKGIGIAYQMHGLVMVDEQQNVLHPAIIWCDGRAVDIGKKAFDDLGNTFCLENYLNSPANFTASKLRWVKENKPDLFSRIHKVMLPGDYIAMKLSGTVRTSISGLSEGIFWNYKSNSIAQKLLDYYEIPADLLPEYDPNFAVSGALTEQAAQELGLRPDIPIGYRSGDQPNNALSLNVLDPGEVAATAGTSGVIYGVTDQPIYDKKSRVNTFIHVNNDDETSRYGILLCINGTGIQNSWLRNKLFNYGHSYEEINEMADEVPIGSEGVNILPFGNGPERVFENRDVGAQIKNIHFNRHHDGHIMRAAQEGIAFSLNYGLQVMKQMGMDIDTIRVGNENMFLSPVFREAFTNVTGVSVELYDTNGALGAAIGAGLGTGVYKDREEAFQNLEMISRLIPKEGKLQQYKDAYQRWERDLEKELDN